MHLTNYAINKNSSLYQQNDNKEGSGKSHKRSMKEIFKQMEADGVETSILQNSIDDLIVKTLLTA